MSAFYKIDSTGFSFREYWWGARSPMVIFAWLIKLTDAQPAPGANQFSTWSGSVMRSGLILRFNWLTFNRVFDGAPALVDWLCAKRCIDLKYDWHAGGYTDQGEDGE